MQFCAYRDRSHKEVEEKLGKMNMIPAAKEQIIIQLMQEDFLNEERFARSFVRGKFRIKKWGRIKIKQELKFREISAPIIKSALTEIDQQRYISTLYELAEKKLKLLKEPDTFKKKRKLADFLLRKGYESNLVYEATNELLEWLLEAYKLFELIIRSEGMNAGILCGKSEELIRISEFVATMHATKNVFYIKNEISTLLKKNWNKL